MSSYRKRRRRWAGNLDGLGITEWECGASYYRKGRWRWAGNLDGLGITEWECGASSYRKGRWKPRRWALLCHASAVSYHSACRMRMRALDTAGPKQPGYLVQ